MVILYYNARSLLPKFDELLLQVDSLHPDIICITESWLSSDILDSEIAIPGYNVVRNDRNQHGGGVIMFISANFVIKYLPNCTGLEVITVTLHCKNHRVCLQLFYRPPTSPTDVLHVLQNYYLSINIAQFSNFIVIGDFNINVCISSDLLSNFSSSLGLTQAVNHPTHIYHGRSHSLIDLVFVSNMSYFSSCQVIPPLANSDQFGICVYMRLKSSRRVDRPHRVIWQYAHADWDRARELLDAVNWDALYSDNINIFWMRWHKVFLNIMEQCIPKLLITKGRNLPWMSVSIKKAMQKRDRLFKRFGYHAKYKAARNRVTNLLRRAKRQYFHQLNPNDPKSFWKYVKFANNSEPSIPVLQCDGFEYVTDQEKAQKLNSYFSSCFNTSHPPLLPTGVAFLEDQQLFVDLYCTVEEVEHALQCLVSSKASGPDKISARMLKHTASSIAPSITELFNCSIRSGRLPDEWKTSMIVPIPKGSMKSNPANYRPISLICILCKLLEKYIYSLIIDHLNVTKELSATQWGFRSGRSTVTALLSVTQDWFAALESGKEICAIFFDYQKAFDSVPHAPLLARSTNLQFSPAILQWLTDYLTNRRQFVVVNGAESNLTPVLSGVPQGSILGPLLFLLYIDEISSVPLSCGSRLHLYADDVLLYSVIEAHPATFIPIQNDISKIAEWSVDNYLTLNLSVST